MCLHTCPAHKQIIAALPTHGGALLCDVENMKVIPDDPDTIPVPFPAPMSILLFHRGERRIRLHPLITNVGALAHIAGAKFERLPDEWVHKESKHDLRARFWTRWTDDTELARGQGANWNNTQWAKFIDRRNASLAYAPQWWLHKIYNLRKLTHHRSITRGTWIYVMCNAQSRAVYVGQTGARGTLKSIVTRWRQHGRAKRSFATLYVNKHCRSLSGLYEVLSRTGLENWGIIALEQCPPHKANTRERYWIRKLTPNLNIRDTPKFSRKWELLFRGGMVEADPDRRSIQQKIEHIQHTLRTHATLLERLSLLHRVRRHVTSDTCNYLYQKVSHNIRQATGLTLPQRMPMRVPQLRGIDGKALRDNIASYFSTLPIPQALCELRE